MSNIGEAEVLKALEGVQDPDLGRDLTELGMIRDVKVEGSRVSLTVNLTTPACPLKDKIADDVKSAIINRIEAIDEVDVNFTASVKRSMSAGAELIPGVRNVVLVGSGKGGVGKSTISSNLALALAQTGASVGLLDADIYGPSLPTAFGLRGQRPEATADQRIVPLEKHGMKLMSMGLLIEEGQPVIWRGPMLDGALQQFLGQVDWGNLDYLVVDLPPGTGDVQLSLSRLLPQAYAVIVTTPQDIALADVSRAFNMFRQVNVSVLGLIENMSGFVCSKCGHVTDLFLKGGGKRAAETFKVRFFGEIPLSERIALLTDKGTPALIVEPSSDYALQIEGIAGEVARAVAVESDARNVPEDADPAGPGQSAEQGGHRPISVAPVDPEPEQAKPASAPASTGYSKLC